MLKLINIHDFIKKCFRPDLWFISEIPHFSASRVFLHNNGNSLYIYIMNYYHDKDGKTFDDK